MRWQARMEPGPNLGCATLALDSRSLRWFALGWVTAGASCTVKPAVAAVTRSFSGIYRYTI